MTTMNSQPASNHNPADALGRMSREIYDEYRNLKYAGIATDPARYLAYREQTRNTQFTKLVVSDAGVFLMDPARKIKFTFDPGFFLVYHDGLTPAEEEIIRASERSFIRLENGLEFWKRHGTGLCLVADHLNGCDYLLPERKTELDGIKRLYSSEGFVLNQMLHKKKAEDSSGVSLMDLNDL
jgi:hypothetical protein